MRTGFLLLIILVGGLMGGVIGLLLGVGAVVIPGLGPLIAAGTIATALGTAFIGAVAGALLAGGVGLLVLTRTSQIRR